MTKEQIENIRDLLWGGITAVAVCAAKEGKVTRAIIEVRDEIINDVLKELKNGTNN